MRYKTGGEAMLAVVATIKVKPGSEAEFEAVAKELAAQVNAKEPGCRLYILTRSPSPQTYVFMERYDDQAASDAHVASEHFRDLGRKMGAFLDGRPDIQRLTEV